ncbi:MAG: glycosyltransferase family 39 protein [Alphaproteobacteria bacterium]|nr:glycosyltransferase family 39 protein [Alphaproteobacteria bacterium]
MFLIQDCGWDDFEHLASGWFIFNGYVPYRDFFQHHHPLLWYLMTPVFYFVDHPIDSFWIGRVVAAIFWCGGCFLIGKIVRALGGGIRSVLYGLLVYLSCPTVVEIYIQNRPDTYMNFFLLWGLYEWIMFFTHKKTKNLAFCYLFFFVAFAFLQKSLLVLFPFGLYQLYLLMKKEIKWQTLIKAIILPVILACSYGGYLAYKGILIRYWELNWVLNAHWFRDYQTYNEDIPDYFYAGLYMVFCLCGAFASSKMLRGLSLCGLLFGLIFYSIPRPYTYYWASWTPFAAIAMGLGLENLTLSSQKIKKLFAAGTLLFALFFAGCYLFIPAQWKLVGSYFEENIKCLSPQIKKGEQLIDYADLYAVFLRNRPEHYYWFSLQRGALYDSRLFHRHQIPQWDKVVYEQKPRYIKKHKVYDWTSTETGNEDILLMGLDKNWLEEHYQEVKQLNLWVRKGN